MRAMVVLPSGCPGGSDLQHLLLIASSEECRLLTPHR